MEPLEIISIILISIGTLAIIESIFIKLFSKQMIKIIKYFSKPERINKISLIELITGIILTTIGIILIN